MRKIRTTIYYEVEYLPTTGRRNTETISKEVELEVEEVTEEQFPVAAIVKSKQDMFSGREPEGDVTCELCTDYIRFYNGKLWSALRCRHNSAVSKDSFVLPDEIPKRLDWGSPSGLRHCDHIWGQEDEARFDSETSKILSTTEEDVLKKIKKKLRNFLVFEGVVWFSCGEPVYEVYVPFAYYADVLRIEIRYISPFQRTMLTNTFSAMQREECIKFAKGKGTKEAVARFEASEENIIVKMPSVFSFRRVIIDKGCELNLSYCLDLLRMQWKERHREEFHYDKFNMSVVMDEGKFQVDAQRNDGQIFKTAYDTIDDVLIDLFNGFGATDRYWYICDVITTLA